MVSSRGVLNNKLCCKFVAPYILLATRNKHRNVGHTHRYQVCFPWWDTFFFWSHFLTLKLNRMRKQCDEYFFSYMNSLTARSLVNIYVKRPISRFSLHRPVYIASVYLKAIVLFQNTNLTLTRRRNYRFWRRSLLDQW